jgi:predicted transcriptional regulator
MSQTEIIKLLKKYPKKWFTISEMSKILKRDRTVLNRAAFQLRKYSEVFWKIGGWHNQEYLYKNRCN